MPTISPMTESDLDFALSMTDRENWGYVIGDFDRLIRLSPRGCFVARVDRQPVGIITSVHYDDFAFLGSLIVLPQYRHQKTGEKIMLHAMDSLRKQGVRYFELDAVSPALTLYRRLGFKDKYLSLRFVRPAAEKTGDEIGKRCKYSIDDLVDFDRLVTGFDRSELLRDYNDEYGDSLYTIDNRSLSGYAFVMRRKGDFFKLGPMVATSPGAAEKLMSRVLSDFPGQSIVAGTPEINQAAAGLFRSLGFVYNPPSVRMYLGERRDYEQSIYGIAAADKG